VVPTSRSLRLTTLLTVASLALVACTGGSTPAPSGGASTQPSTQPSSAASPGASVEASPSPAAGTLPEPEDKDLTIGLSVTETSQYAGKLAEQLEIYQKHGFENVEVTVFEGDARVAQALQAGQVDIGFSGTSSAISSQLTDVPYVVAGVLAIILTDDLVCQAGIDSAETIKARPSDGAKATIAISTFGGTSNAAALLALKALNLSPTDAVITQIGGQDSRIAALVGGSVDCAIVDSVLRDDMVGQGFAIATQLQEANIEFGRSGMSFTREYMDANPNTVLTAVASVLEAQNTIWADPDTVTPLYAEFSQRDEASAADLIENFTRIGNRDMYATEQAFINPQKAIAVANPDIIDVNIADAYDMSYLDTLAENGFYDLIGSPVPS
jgi:ABC-type nitrate/sulfonate/bicarbonate transport system substrate-binding protein